MRFYERKKNCENCGQEILIPSKHVWAYRIKEYKDGKHCNVKYFCSHKCKSEYERNKENEKK